jgi:hypothetical protein
MTRLMRSQECQRRASVSVTSRSARASARAVSPSASSLELPDKGACSLPQEPLGPVAEFADDLGY